jgi:hypothetical protein
LPAEDDAADAPLVLARLQELENVLAVPAEQRYRAK